MDNNNGKVNVISDTFEWIFEGFSVNDCKQEQLLSPKFTIEASKKVFKWQLNLYPRGLKNKNYLALYLISLNKFDVEAEYTLYFIDSKNKKLRSELSKKNIFRENTDFGFEEFIKISLMKNQKNFSILCSITMNIVLTKIIKQNDQFKMISNDLRLKELDSLEKLIENDDELSDVSLTVGGEIFHAHKCILANKSPVFSAMFKHDMKEKKTDTIIIEDIEIGVFKEMLRFIYVGRVNCIEKIADNLFIAADKYSLEGLKILCIMSLCDTVSVENAVKYLELADLYDLNVLQEEILDFIAQHLKEMIDLPEFKQMGIRKPELQFKVLRALALEMETLRNDN